MLDAELKAGVFTNLPADVVVVAPAADAGADARTDAGACSRRQRPTPAPHPPPVAAQAAPAAPPRRCQQPPPADSGTASWADGPAARGSRGSGRGCTAETGRPSAGSAAAGTAER